MEITNAKTASKEIQYEHEFVKQVFRKDVLSNILANNALTGFNYSVNTNL